MTKGVILMFWLITLVGVHCARIPNQEKEENLIEDLLGIQDLQNSGADTNDRAGITTPPTPPTPGVVTMTSAPSRDDKYLKKIEKLLFANLLVVTAIFVTLAAKFVFSAVVKLASTEKTPKYKNLDTKKIQKNKF